MQQAELRSRTVNWKRKRHTPVPFDLFDALAHRVVDGWAWEVMTRCYGASTVVLLKRLLRESNSNT